MYIATQGDTWDSISYVNYNTEYNVSMLMMANPHLCDVVIFEGGERVTIPEIVETATSTPWRDE